MSPRRQQGSHGSPVENTPQAAISSIETTHQIHSDTSDTHCVEEGKISAQPVNDINLDAEAYSEASLQSSLFAETPSIISVVEADLLDARSFNDLGAIPRSPLFQTKLATEYYDQALDLHGEKLTVRRLIGHLLDQHPNGLIPALTVMHEVISNGHQWKSLCFVKGPGAIKGKHSPHQTVEMTTTDVNVKQPNEPDQPERPNMRFKDMISTNETRMQTLLMHMFYGPNDSMDLSNDPGEAGTSAEAAAVNSSQPINWQPSRSTSFLWGKSSHGNVQQQEAVRAVADASALWLEVVARPFIDPISGRKLVIIQQYDLTPHIDRLSVIRAREEFSTTQRLQALSSTLSSHILEALESTLPQGLIQSLPIIGRRSSSGDHSPPPEGSKRYLPRMPTRDFDSLARSFQGVTILFMVSFLERHCFHHYLHLTLYFN